MSFLLIASQRISMYHSENPLNIAILGNVMRGGIGDEMVCIPAYYALKALYPKSFLTLLTRSKITIELLKQFSYIDKIVNIAENQEWQRNFDILLVIEHNALEVLRIAQLIQAKRKITTLSQSLLFFKRIPLVYLKHLQGIKTFLNPYWSQTHNEIQRNLNLVRRINPRVFDKKIHSIDFSLAKLPISEVALQRVQALCFNEGENVQYSSIIGVFPFTKGSKSNFTILEWIFLVQTLSKEFPKTLFIFVNYHRTRYHFVPFNEKNIKVFYNEQGLEDLIAFIHCLDGILGVDSGHIHLADNAQIPTLEVIKKEVSKQWAGGFYGGYFDFLAIPLHWRREEQRYLESFLQKARDLIVFVKNHEES